MNHREAFLHSSYGGIIEHFDFAWRTDGAYYALHCMGPRARWEHLEPYFRRVADSFALEEGS